MKKLAILLLSLMLLMVAAPALADYQEDFELSCDRKTDAAAMIYYTCKDDAAAVDRIDCGTYVQVLDRGYGEWVEIIYMVDEIQHHGWINVPLVKCVSLVVDAQGYLSEVHELDPDYLNKINSALELIEEAGEVWDSSVDEM